MDRTLSWSPEAIEDLESIAEYIEKSSAFYARAIVTRVMTTVQTLPEFPLLGRVVPELGNDNIRERFVYSYRVIYQVSWDNILVLAIIHGKRLLEGVDDRFG